MKFINRNAYIMCAGKEIIIIVIVMIILHKYVIINNTASSRLKIIFTSFLNFFTVYGKNFCTSARDAFFLLMRNAVRAFVLDKVTDFLLFMGKLVIVGGVSIFSFYIFSGKYGILNEQVKMIQLTLLNFVHVYK